MKKSAFQFFLSLLCLLLMVTCASGETRESVIWLEGMEETIIETKFESPEGFSFWYDADLMEADFATADETERIRVSNIDSDDFMLLSLISQEEADELIRDREVETAHDPETGRVTTEVYCELENTTFHFLTLVSFQKTERSCAQRASIPWKPQRAMPSISVASWTALCWPFRQIRPQNNPAG